MNRESYLLRQRLKPGERGEDTPPDSVNHLDSDEQEVVVKSLATEAHNQATFFSVRDVTRISHQVTFQSTKRWRILCECGCVLLYLSPATIKGAGLFFPVVRASVMSLPPGPVGNLLKERGEGIDRGSPQMYKAKRRMQTEVPYYLLLSIQSAVSIPLSVSEPIPNSQHVVSVSGIPDRGESVPTGRQENTPVYTSLHQSL